MKTFCDIKKSHSVICGIFFIGVFIAIDQIIKTIVIQSKTIGHLCNHGIAMGIVLPQLIFIIIWGVLMLCVVYFWWKHISKRFFMQLPYVFILAGGLSNSIDRLHYGCVVDYIPLLNISSFNFADVCITVGAGVILLTSFKSDKKRL